MKIEDIVKNFMGRKITKEGTSKFWGTDELHLHCLHALDRMSIEDRFRFLMQQGLIEECEESDDPHMPKPNLE